MKHFIFRVGLDPEEFTLPICGVSAGLATETHYEFTDCPECRAIIQRTLFEALGPKTSESTGNAETARASSGQAASSEGRPECTAPTPAASSSRADAPPSPGPKGWPPNGGWGGDDEEWKREVEWRVEILERFCGRSGLDALERDMRAAGEEGPRG